MQHSGVRWQILDEEWWGMHLQIDCGHGTFAAGIEGIAGIVGATVEAHRFDGIVLGVGVGWAAATQPTEAGGW